jgi:hypothetical protein
MSVLGTVPPGDEIDAITRSGLLELGAEDHADSVRAILRLVVDIGDTQLAVAEQARCQFIEDRSARRTARYRSRE